MIMAATTDDGRAAALDVLEENGKLLLSRAASRDDEISRAVWQVAFPPGDYSYQDVQAFNAEIDASTLTVRQWLKKGCPTCLGKR